MKKIENICEFGDCRTIMRKWKKQRVLVQSTICSPPYFNLRKYTDDGENEIGRESDPQAYVDALVEVFECVRAITRDDGVLWLNISDTYFHSGLVGSKKVSKTKKHTANVKVKDLIGIPWMVAFALRDAGWFLRSEVIWSKPNPMPESVTDRPTRSHEQIFLFSKSKDYYYNNQAVKENTTTQHDYIIDTSKGKMNTTPGRTKMGGLKHNNYPERNKRSVWTVQTEAYRGSHFAVFPEALITPCVLTSTKKGDIILDPFLGSGTTAKVAKHYGRKYLGCELNEDACRHLQEERIRGR